MKFPRWFHQLGSPPYIYALAGKLTPWFAVSACVLLVVGAYLGLFVAPTHSLQGDSYRIIFVHVPSAYIGMLAYVIMAVSSGIGFIWRMKLAYAVAVSAAPIGAWFTFLALLTGVLWARPTWGEASTTSSLMWLDPRVLSELLSLFLYLGYLLLRAAYAENREKADRTSGILAVVGAVNIPIIHFSVTQASLHQGPTIGQLDEPSMHPDMLTPLLIMIVGFSLVFVWMLLTRLRGEVVSRERDARWLRQRVSGTAG
jgi:heme exporter protein C